MNSIKSYLRHSRFRFPVYGFFVGCFFLLAKLVLVQKEWILILVDLSPLLLCAIGYLIGFKEDQSRTLHQALADKETDRERTEAEVWVISEMQRAILAGANYSIISTDKDGIIQSFNSAAERMLGYKAEEVIGKTTPGLFHESSEVIARAEALSHELGEPITPGFNSFVAKARRGIPDENEWTYIHQNGTKFPVRLCVTAIYDKSGSLMGFVGMAQDISEDRRVAQELVASKEEAISAAKTKSTFLANMSHEIRTPMNGIIGMTNLLLATVRESEQFEKLRVIQNCANSLLDLINDVLDFSKLELDKLSLEEQPFGLKLTVDEVIDLLQPKAVEKNLQLSYVHGSKVPPWIIGDVTRFRQVLTNLVGNAIKFTERGRIQITSSAETFANGQVNLQFSVNDSGIGIPKDVLSKLFLSFSQVDASTTRKYGGTGLGLAICKGLCEKMGGRIWVESEIGQGSVFSFTIKTQACPAQHLPAKINPFSQFDSLMAQKHPLQILIAEDSRTNQLVATGLLGKLGYRADVAANGNEAIECLHRQDYDLILMDCHMPEMDGFEATIKIVEMFPEERRPRIVALSASTLREDIDRCFQSGMNGFIAKPISLPTLVTVLDETPSGRIFIRNSPADKLKFEKHNSSMVFNAANFFRNFIGMEDVALETIHSFLESLPGMKKNIDSALQNKDAHQLELAAHTLAGAVSNFYSTSCCDLAMKLESLGKENRFSEVEKVNVSLRKELGKLERMLNDYLARNRTAA